MDIELIKESKTPLYLQIANSIKRMILDQELLCGFKLPAERALAKQLRIHRNTVIKAYRVLIDEQLIISSVNPRGYLVIHDPEDYLRKIQKSGRKEKNIFPFDYMVRDEFTRMNMLFNRLCDLSVEGKVISFATEMPAKELYPKEDLDQILLDIVREDKYDLYGYCVPQGVEVLRSNVAKLLEAREIYVNPSEIQIVSETYQVLDFLIKLFVSPGDIVLAEEPIMADFFNYFRMMGADVVTIPMDEDGMKTDLLEQLIIKYHPKFIYTIPTLHYPSGAVMSLERRRQLLEISYRHNIPIVEEGCDPLFLYGNKRIPTLKSMDTKQNVIYIDSFGFSAFPGARVGFAVAQKKVIRRLSHLMDFNQIFVSSISQYVINEFLERGCYQVHMKKVQMAYQKKLETACYELNQITDIPLKFNVPDGGTSIWCQLPPGINQTKLLIAAHRRGVSFAPGYLFYPYGNEGEDFIRIAVGTCSEEQIKTGISVLADTMREHRRNSQT